MKFKEAMTAQAEKGSEQIKLIYIRHGAREPLFGMKIGDMKVIAKKLKAEHAIVLQLYATGNGDAQYLAGLLANGARLTCKVLHLWATMASWRMVSNTTARKLSPMEADVGDTDCHIPDSESYILKSRRGAPIAPKRKTVRC